MATDYAAIAERIKKGEPLPSGPTSTPAMATSTKKVDYVAIAERIKNEGKKQTALTPQQEKKSWLSKAAGVTDSIFKKPSEFLFGTTAKTVVPLVGQGVEAGYELTNGKKSSGKYKKMADKNITPGNIAMTGLELLPGDAVVAGFKKIPGVSKVPKWLSNKAMTQYSEALAPTTREAKQATQTIVPQLLKERKTAGYFSGLEKLQKEARKNMSIKGGLIEETVENLPPDAVTKTKPILESIDAYKKQFVVKGKVISPRGVRAADSLYDVVSQFGDEIPQQDLISLRRILDKEVAAGRGFLGGVKNTFATEVRKEATDAIRNEIAKDIPDLAKLNKSYSFWRNVDDVVTKTIERKTGQSGLLKEASGQILGGIIGSGAGPVASGMGAALGGTLSKAFRSAAWKTKSAVSKQKIADAIISGKTTAVIEALRLAGVLGNNLFPRSVSKREDKQSR